MTSSRLAALMALSPSLSLSSARSLLRMVRCRRSEKTRSAPKPDLALNPGNDCQRFGYWFLAFASTPSAHVSSHVRAPSTALVSPTSPTWISLGESSLPRSAAPQDRMPKRRSMCRWRPANSRNGSSSTVAVMRRVAPVRRRQSQAGSSSAGARPCRRYPRVRARCEAARSEAAPRRRSVRPIARPAPAPIGVDGW
jgi:hypothetical protein